jgi:hypothetical protein
MMQKTISIDYEQPETSVSGEAGVCSTRHAWATDKSSNHMRPSIAPWKRPRSA